MSSFHKKINFYESEQGIATKKALRLMVSDLAYTTESSYNADSQLYPGHDMSFVEKHMHYLSQHRNVDPNQYLSNLRLMTRVRN